jgi:hypothetical protein
MWSTLALSAALLSPAQPAALQLNNVRMTVGELGPPRKDSKLPPGDILFIAFDITGLTVEPDGTAKYTMAMEVTDAAGKAIFKQDPRELSDFVPLGGSRLPARAFITIGLDQDAGSYACKITVTDPKTKASNSLSVKFEVLKRDFGVVAVFTTYDEPGAISAPTSGIVGQTIFVQFSVASFQRVAVTQGDVKSMQPNVEFLFEVLDEKGQPTLVKPRKHVQNSGVDEKVGAFGMRFPLFMTRPGKFTFRVTATDKVANKKSVYDLPFTVLPAS